MAEGLVFADIVDADVLWLAKRLAETSQDEMDNLCRCEQVMNYVG